MKSQQGGTPPIKKVICEKGVNTMKNTNIPRSQMIKFLVFVPLFFAFSLGMNWLACQFFEQLSFSTMVQPHKIASMLAGCGMFGWFLFIRKYAKKQAA